MRRCMPDGRAEDIIKPYITESSRELANGKYTLSCIQRLPRQIRQAVEELFNVKALSVHTANYKGK